MYVCMCVHMNECAYVCIREEKRREEKIREERTEGIREEKIREEKREP